MTKERLLLDLESTRIRTLAFFDLGEEDLSRSYAPGKWSIRQLLHHITDAETVLYDRIRRVIAEPRQVLWAFQQDLWDQNLGYQSMPLKVNKPVFQAVRNAVIYLTEQHYKTLGHKEFVHSETGVRTLKDEFEKIAWHNEGHLNQIEIALKRQP